MRLKKKTWLIIAIGIFVIMLVALGMVRSQRIQQQDQLNKELTAAQLNLNKVQLEKLLSGKAELEGQLSQAKSQSEVVKTILSQPVGGIDATNTLYQFAEAHGLEVTELTSYGTANETLEEITCSVVSLTAKVEGDVPNLVSFVTKLNSHFTTGVIDPIKITIPETNSGENATAEIQLTVYTHQGD